MKAEVIAKDKARQEMSDWLSGGQELKKLSSEYEGVRTILSSMYASAETDCEEDDIRKDYLLDVKYGILLYDYLNSQDWFSLRLAADDGFWRYLSVVVIPHVVAERWGDSNDKHFWSQSNRIWLKTLWWYIYLTWHENSSLTKEMLSKPSFNTDIIQGLNERAGQNGTYVDLYRLIAYYYSLIPLNDIIKFKKKQTSKNDSLFRSIMKLNTAKSLVIDPCLYSEGVDGYVKSLFSEFNIKL